MALIRRIFLGWDNPALVSAANWLLREHALSPGDLSQTLVVVPGRRAARRLIEILVELAEDAGYGLAPPRAITASAVPELLYSPQRPFADELTQRLAWMTALRVDGRAALREIIADLPADDDTTGWLQLADVVRRQHRELAADGIDFAAVMHQTRTLGQPQESLRWQCLETVHAAYLAVLERLKLWDVQTARLVAIRQSECRTEWRIVLLAVADMNGVLRQMLDQVAEHVTALVFAPEELADRFDEHGCAVPAAWADAPVPLDPTHIHLADDAADQADWVLRCLAGYSAKYRPDQIAVGLADESIVPRLQRHLQQSGVPTRFGGGTLLVHSGPYRLCEAVASYLQREQFEQLAALVRHPDLYEWLFDAGPADDCLTELDTYQDQHLQTRLASQSWLGRPERCARIQRVCARIEHLLAPLSGRRPLGDWTAPLTELLATVYGDRTLNQQIPAERLTLAAIDQLQAALLAQQNAARQLMPVTTAAEALRQAMEVAGRAATPPPAMDGAVELLGWLELPLDDAPALIVTSFNEGHVPSSTGPDLFLPDSLRRSLGLEDNRRRYARDAYALAALAASRESLDLVVGRRTETGDPLLPSRLLFACDQRELVDRVRSLFRWPESRQTRRPLAGALLAKRADTAFTVPPPLPLSAPLTRLRATAFDDYIACPYRFYLRHILQLKVLDDAAQEMDGPSFGSLAHSVLARFGQHEGRTSTSPDEIARLLDQLLDQVARTLYGRHARAAVRVQIEQLRLRLRAFAQQQATWAAKGWQIVYTEQPDDGKPYDWLVDGQPFSITGRIDRIDRNEHSGQWALLDYKSSDTPTPPEKAHYSQRDGWISLQLPLYRHLASVLDVNGHICLGYVALPKDPGQVRFHVAEWTDNQLQEADERAREVIRALRDQRFWPPIEPPPRFSEIYASLCMDGIFERPPLKPVATA